MQRLTKGLAVKVHSMEESVERDLLFALPPLQTRFPTRLLQSRGYFFPALQSNEVAWTFL